MEADKGISFSNLVDCHQLIVSQMDLQAIDGMVTAEATEHPDARSGNQL